MPQQFQYGLNILNNVLWRIRQLKIVDETATDYYESVMGYVQRGYYDLLSHAPWKWGLKDPPGTLDILHQKTGTVTCTQDSASVTLGATVTPSLAGWWFKIDAENVLYRISSHTAGTAAVTLDATYKEENVTLGAYTVFKDEYALVSDCLKIWRAWNRKWPSQPIKILSPEEIHNWRTDRDIYTTSTGIFEMAQIRNDKVRIYPWPYSENITVEYEYSIKPSADLTFDQTATDTPIIPIESRHVIADWALVLLASDLGDQRVSLFNGALETKLLNMKKIYIWTGKPQRHIPSGKGIGQ